MLDPKRNKYLTASIAHIVMAGFQTELSGMSSPKPDFEDIPFNVALDWIDKHQVKPKVSDLKEIDVILSGEDINQIYKYYRSQEKPFTQGMETAALNIAMSEFLQERDEGYKSKDMERGNIQEGEAIMALSDRTGVTFDNIDDDQVFLTKGVLGVTPDGIQYDGFDVKSCAEVKNPKDTTHMKYLSGIRNQDDLLKICPDYYWQAQCGLAVTNAEIYHWASYHNGYIDSCKLVYVAIKPNHEHISMLKIRSERVMSRVPDIIESINNWRR